MAIPQRLETLTSLPAEALVSAKELSILSGRSRASIWRDVQAGRLPQPIAIGPQARRWRVSDVRAYLNGGVS
ncbi:helix-turn-helix transcriptional regulator [Roseobacter sp. HKCC-CH-9208]|uniref:helix-turn-helix transcriptional regulator n=1 Tax=Roseobacter sp. HKCC-CH-9208 TaxID=3120339 RepID=UPI001D47EAE0|nr:AlpA family phage regulatory protein [Rhodobacterales bacterium FZCC0069]MBF9024064.1 AlpA family phage regulatory protein [Rhodobacterales bacterium HKCCD6035]